LSRKLIDTDALNIVTETDRYRCVEHCHGNWSIPMRWTLSRKLINTDTLNIVTETDRYRCVEHCHGNWSIQMHWTLSWQLIDIDALNIVTLCRSIVYIKTAFVQLI